MPLHLQLWKHSSALFGIVVQGTRHTHLATSAPGIGAGRSILSVVVGIREAATVASFDEAHEYDTIKLSPISQTLLVQAIANDSTAPLRTSNVPNSSAVCILSSRQFGALTDEHSLGPDQVADWSRI